MFQKLGFPIFSNEKTTHSCNNRALFYIESTFSVYEALSGPATWACELCKFTGLPAWKGPKLSVMLCWCHLELLPNICTKDHFHFALACKLGSQFWTLFNLLPILKCPTCPGLYFYAANSFLPSLKYSKHVVVPGSQQISGCQSFAHSSLHTVSRLILVSVVWACLYSSLIK